MYDLLIVYNISFTNNIHFIRSRSTGNCYYARIFDPPKSRQKKNMTACLKYSNTAVKIFKLCETNI